VTAPAAGALATATPAGLVRRSGARAGTTSRVPLCAAHLAAHDQQVARRGLAIAEWWNL
jgi:hypothetical protein